MRRADRLFKLIDYLRNRHRAVTAQRIAEEFEVCTRTVYRDIHALMDSGVPITGEAGVGYLINKQYFLPPITFSLEELEAISLGITMVHQWTDEKFAKKANQAFEKIQAILPAPLQKELQQISIYAIKTKPILPWSISFSDLRECIRIRRKIHIEYSDETKKHTSRIVRPLALIFVNSLWLLVGWCEKRKDFRHFRIDRINTLKYCEESFDDEQNKNLEAYTLQQSACHPA